MVKFTIRTVVLANVEVAFEVEASSEAEARQLALQGGGKTVSQDIDWESADFQFVDVNGEWVSPEEAGGDED